MSVDAVSTTNMQSIAPYTDTSVEQDKDPLGRDAFLKMLMAQMEHQNPLNPMEGTEFSAQLAQFSSLEQMYNVNKNLGKILDSLTGNSDEKNLLEYIGKNIASKNDQMKIESGVASTGMYTLDEPAEVQIYIYNQYGQQVKTIFAGNLDPGIHQIDWDGTSDSGEKLDDGSYTYGIIGKTESGSLIPVRTTVEGKVTGTTTQDGKNYLLLGDNPIDPDTVYKVWSEDDNTQNDFNVVDALFGNQQ